MSTSQFTAPKSRLDQWLKSLLTRRPKRGTRRPKRGTRRRRNTVPAACEQLETRVLLTAGQFIDSGQQLMESPEFASTSQTRDVVLADADGDGDFDAFVANGLNYPSGVWLNDGGGNFDKNHQIFGFEDSYQIDAGDVDGDGDIDAILANTGSGTTGTRVLFNNGSGVFTDSGQSLGAAQAVSLHDLDGDGDLDAFVNNTHIYKNDGSGTFTHFVSISHTTSGVADSVFDDLDGDGDLDLFLAFESNKPNQVWSNDGSAGFTNSGQNLGNGSTENVVLGDVDGDGDLDALAANYGGGQDTLLWLNDGNGQFSHSGQADHIISDRRQSVALADLDNDGDLDAFVGSKDAVWLNDGNGGFTDTGQNFNVINGHSTAIALEDLDQDGDMDAFVVSRNSSNRVFVNQTIDINSQPTITNISNFTIEENDIKFLFSGVTIDDADGDSVSVTISLSPTVQSELVNLGSFVDLGNGVYEFQGTAANATAAMQSLVFKPIQGRIAERSFLETQIVVKVSDHKTQAATRTLTAKLQRMSGGDSIDFVQTQTLSSFRATDVELGDVDGDGDLDAVVSTDNNEANQLWFNDGLGSFTLSSQALGTGKARGVEVGDLDGDGDLDIVLGYYNTDAEIWLNNGSGSFSNTQSLNAEAKDVGLADLDGDGDLDIVFASNFTSSVWLNDGNASFSFANSLSHTGIHTDVVQLGDLNNDGHTDAVFGFDIGWQNEIWLNDGSGNLNRSSVFENIWDGSIYGLSTNGLSLGDVDNDGDLDISTANYRAQQPNQIWLNDGAGNFSNSGQVLGRGAQALALGDLDNDGDLDVFHDADEHIWRNNGSGVFSAHQQSLSTNQAERDIALGDLDGDGDLDAFAIYFSQPHRVFLNQLTIPNADPVASVSGLTSVDEGTEVTLTGSFTDPDIGTLHYQTWSVVASNGQSIPPLNIPPQQVSLGSGGSTFSFTPANEGTYTVSYTVTDDLGASDTVQQVITVTNQAPIVTGVSLNNLVIDENGTVTATVTFDDPGTSDTHTLQMFWGDGAAQSIPITPAGSRTITVSHQYKDDPTGTGPDTYQLRARVFDDTGFFAQDGFATLTVNNVAPTAANQSLTVTEDSGATSLNVLAGLIDPGTLDTHTAVAGSFATGLGGLVTIQSDGTATYNPNGQFESLAVGESATDSFTYTVLDDDSGSDSATVTITINGVNDAPVAVDDSYQTDEDSLLSPSNASPYANEVLSDNPLGYWRLGETSGTTAVDSSGRGNDGSYNGSVTLGASGSTADGDTSLALTSAAGYVSVGNPTDLDISDDTLTIEAWVNPSEVRTMPIAGKSKPSFNDYTIWLIASGGRNVAHLNLYNGSGEGPIVGTMEIPVGEWTHIVGTYDGTTAKIYVNGVLDRSIAYSGNISGSDSLNFEIGRRTVTGTQFRGQIDEVAVYGEALTSDRILAHYNAAATGIANSTVLSNDSDVDGGTLTVTALNGVSSHIGQATVLASGASLTLNSDGTFNYDPTTSATLNALAVGESVVDNFQYTVGDGQGGSDTATVSITVNGLNDAPTLAANQATVSVDEGGTATNLGTFGDIDNGSVVSLSTSTGTVTKNANGTWDWSFDITDGPTESQVVTVTATDDKGAASQITFQLNVNNVAPDFEAGADETLLPPVAGVFSRALSFTDPGNDVWSGTVNFGDNTGNQVLAISQSAKTFELNHTYTADGTYTVTIIVADEDGGSRTDTFDVTVQLNTPPVANDDNAITNEDTAVTLNVLTNDTDAQNNIVPGQTLAVTSPAVGVLTDNGNGSFTFNPNAQFESLAASESAQVQFDYQIKDAFGATDQATVTITIQGVNDTPVLTNVGNITVNEGQTAVNTGTYSDSDASDTVTLSASVGTVVKNANGTWDWSWDTTDDPAQSQTVTITATDSQGASVLSTFNLTVVNVAPTILTAPANQSADEGQTLSFTATASDPGNDSLSYAWSFGDGNTGSGSTVMHTYADNGVYTVTLTVTDGDGGSALQMFAVTVANVAPLSTATGPNVAVRNRAVMWTGSFTDPGTADTHHESWKLTDAVGTILATGTGSTFESVPSELGTYTVTYTVLDDDGGVHSSSLSVDVVAAAVIPNPDDPGTSILIVGGSDLAEKISLRPQSGGIRVEIRERQNSGAETVRNLTYSEAVSEIFIHAGGGDDMVQLHKHLPVSSTVYAGAGDDLVFGSARGETIYGQAGDDALFGRGGDDFIDGGEGNDKIWGNNGDDTLLGGEGHDRISSGSGNDHVQGNTGNDWIWGQSGLDQLHGNEGEDIIFGGNGNDMIWGDANDDQLYGQAGDDQIWGGDGDDVLNGGSGNDELNGGSGDDVLFGGAGSDMLIGEDGDDLLFGGSGQDTLDGGDGADLLFGGPGHDEFITDHLDTVFTRWRWFC